MYIVLCYGILYYILRGVFFVAVPESIRKVPRPVNTIVGDNGKEGPNRYPVRERISVTYISGGNPQPKNGKVIGHIVDGVYVPLGEASIKAEPDMLSYGASAFVRSVSRDLFSELLAVYTPKDAYTIIAIASLRVIKPEVSAKRLATQYRQSFISKYYPGIGLSENTVSAFLQGIGRDGSKRLAFYHKRTAAVAADHHVAIDGMLKQDNSIVNDLSAFSYKARTKGCREVSVLYAYDIEAMEPICAEIFPGNSIDATSYKSFIRDNNIQKGIIVADKGFPPSQISDELAERPNLHFLTPIKRNDMRIANNKMLSFEGVLTGIGDHVLYKKKAIKGGRFLYAYRSARKAAAEESSFLARREDKNDYSQSTYEKKKEVFGVIVFESDQDLDPRTAYICYDDRWLLELVFNRYKNDECLDRTNVQGDFSVIGSEFINFISTVITCRLIRKAREAELLKLMSYGDLMDDLNSAWRKVDAPDEPSTDDNGWVHTNVGVFEELEALGLSKPIPKPEPKKRGRKKKESVENKPKRPRGRPRKNPVNPIDKLL